MTFECIEVAQAWQTTSYQLAVICLIIGFAIGRLMPYVIAYIKAWKDGGASE